MKIHLRLSFSNGKITFWFLEFSGWSIRDSIGLYFKCSIKVILYLRIKDAAYINGITEFISGQIDGEKLKCKGIGIE